MKKLLLAILIFWFLLNVAFLVLLLLFSNKSLMDMLVSCNILGSVFFLGTLFSSFQEKTQNRTVSFAVLTYQITLTGSANYLLCVFAFVLLSLASCFLLVAAMPFFGFNEDWWLWGFCAFGVGMNVFNFQKMFL